MHCSEKFIIMRYLLLFYLLSLVACTTSDGPTIALDAAGNEDFQSFRQLYYTDSLFQLQRTEFPLNGRDPNGEQERFYWELDNWRQLKLSDDNPQIKRLPLLNLDGLMVEQIVLQDRFLIETKFSLINGKWYLTDYSGVQTPN